MPCWIIILSSFVIVTNDVSNLILGCALEFNSSLKILNVAYNAFGDIGTQAIGRSLKFNKGRFANWRRIHENSLKKKRLFGKWKSYFNLKNHLFSCHVFDTYRARAMWQPCHLYVYLSSLPLSLSLSHSLYPSFSLSPSVPHTHSSPVLNILVWSSNLTFHTLSSWSAYKKWNW